MLPVSVLLTPMFIMFRDFKLLNTQFAPILADATIGIPFSILILKNYLAPFQANWKMPRPLTAATD